MIINEVLYFLKAVFNALINIIIRCNHIDKIVLKILTIICINRSFTITTKNYEDFVNRSTNWQGSSGIRHCSRHLRSTCYKLQGTYGYSM